MGKDWLKNLFDKVKVRIDKVRPKVLFYAVNVIILTMATCLFFWKLIEHTKPRSHEELIEAMMKCFVAATPQELTFKPELSMNIDGKSTDANTQTADETTSYTATGTIISNQEKTEDIKRQLDAICNALKQDSKPASPEDANSKNSTYVKDSKSEKIIQALQHLKEALDSQTNTITIKATIPKEDMSQCMKGSWNMVKISDDSVKTQLYAITPQEIDNAMRAVALAAHSEIKQDYDNRFSILLTLLSLFGIAWPAIVAFVQHNFNERDLDSINKAITDAEKASTASHKAIDKANKSSETADKAIQENHDNMAETYNRFSQFCAILQTFISAKKLSQPDRYSHAIDLKLFEICLFLWACQEKKSIIKRKSDLPRIKKCIEQLQGMSIPKSKSNSLGLCIKHAEKLQQLCDDDDKKEAEKLCDSIRDLWGKTKFGGTANTGKIEKDNSMEDKE